MMILGPGSIKVDLDKFGQMGPADRRASSTSLTWARDTWYGSYCGLACMTENNEIDGLVNGG